MYGETFYGRHTAQHQLQWSNKNQKWDPLRAMKTLIRRFLYFIHVVSFYITNKLKNKKKKKKKTNKQT